jgi:hypothetical protein
MKISLTVQQIADASLALAQLSRMSFRNSKISYAIIRNMRAVRPVVEDFEKTKNVIIAQYSNGQEGNRITFVGPEEKALFQAEYDKLLKAEEELDIWELSIAALLANDALRGANDVGVNAEQIILLGPFAVDDMAASPPEAECGA